MKKVKFLKIPFKELSEKAQESVRLIIFLRHRRTDQVKPLEAIGGAGAILSILKLSSHNFVIIPIAYAAIGWPIFWYGGCPAREARRIAKIIGRSIRQETFLNPSYAQNYNIEKLKQTYTHAIIDGKGNLVFVREPRKGFFRKALYTARAPFVRKRIEIRPKKRIMARK